jgi:pilus assembly protein Flp/PilA
MLSSSMDQRGNVETGEHAMIKMIKRLKNDVRGATAVEYGLILSLMVIAIVGGLTSFGEGTLGLWDEVRIKIVG